MSQPLALPPELTIYAVGELRPLWLSWADGPSELCNAAVDGSAVDVIDAAGLQLLLSLSRTLGASDQRLQLRNPSAPLAAACEQLGAMHLLASDAAEGATP